MSGGAVGRLMWKMHAGRCALLPGRTSKQALGAECDVSVHSVYDLEISSRILTPVNCQAQAQSQARLTTRPPCLACALMEWSAGPANQTRVVVD